MSQQWIPETILDEHRPWLNSMGFETVCQCGEYWEPLSAEYRVPQLSKWLRHVRDCKKKGRS